MAKFKGSRLIEIPYELYKTNIEFYKDMGGPEKFPSEQQLDKKFQSLIKKHLSQCIGNSLTDVIKNYFEYLKKNKILGDYCDVTLWNSWWNDTEKYTDKLVEKKLMENKITFNFYRPWYYDVVDINNFVVIKILQDIFIDYGYDTYNYEINEIDSHSYVRVSFEKLVNKLF